MTPERWQQIKEVLNAALALNSEERSSYVAQVCAGDTELRD